MVNSTGGGANPDPAQWFYFRGPEGSFGYSMSWINAEYSWVHWLQYSGGKATFIGWYSGYNQYIQQPAGLGAGDVVFYDWNGDNIIDHTSYDVGYGVDPNLNKSWGVPGQLTDDHTSDTTTIYHAFWSHLALNQDWQKTNIFLMHFNV